MRDSALEDRGDYESLCSGGFGRFCRTHLQCVPPLLGQGAQIVPLVTDALAAGVHRGGIVVVQLTEARREDPSKPHGVVPRTLHHHPPLFRSPPPLLIFLDVSLSIRVI